jgi:hypothetical protein
VGLAVVVVVVARMEVAINLRAKGRLSVKIVEVNVLTQIYLINF